MLNTTRYFARFLTSLAVFGLMGSIHCAAQVSPTRDQLLDAGDIGYLNQQPGSLMGAASAVGDFDGDGKNDLAIGAPGQDVVGGASAGRVAILYGYSSTGWLWEDVLYQLDSDVEDSSEDDDHFGAALAVGDFDGDGLDDLAVGVPDEDLATGETDAGAVHVFYGQPEVGLNGDRDQFFTRTVAPGAAEAGSRFGSSLCVGDFNGDGKDDLAIGAPRETFDGHVRAGVVVEIHGSSTGLSPATARSWSQWHLGLVNGTDDAEDFDSFGWSLAAGDLDSDGKDDLVVGAPGETYADVPGIGSVHLVFGTSLGLASNGTIVRVYDYLPPYAALGLSVAVGDMDADGFWEIAAGSPFSRSNGHHNGGIVMVIFGDSIYGRWASQNILRQGDLHAVNEESDHFGTRVAMADFDGDGYHDLAITAPGEQVASEHQAGGVSILEGGESFNHPFVGTTWYQITQGVEDHSEAFDRFGLSLAVGTFEGGTPDLLVGVEEEDLNGFTDTGGVHVFFSEPAPLFTDGFESGDLSAWSVVAQ